MKSAFITGTNNGIGFETAKQLLQNVVRVYIGSRNSENGLQAVEKLEPEGLANAEAIQVDVIDDDSVKIAQTEIGRKTGALDILINNAGINGGAPPYTALESSSDQLMSAFDTNMYLVGRILLFC